MNTNPSAILKVYLGAGKAGGYLPYGQAERMSIAYENDAEAKLAEIQQYLDMDYPPPSWSQTDLAQEQQVFEKMLEQRFPELDKVAINALACRWSYSWK
ncbi:MAG TPA: hypothetical protein VIY48_06325 [Candidatus Paceibacterota bacterium]